MIQRKIHRKEKKLALRLFSTKKLSYLELEFIFLNQYTSHLKNEFCLLSNKKANLFYYTIGNFNNYRQVFRH